MTRASRVAVIAAMACVVVPAVAQERVAIAREPIVWIAGGTFVMGASDADVAYAAQLCLDDLEVVISPLDPNGCETRFSRFETPQRRVFVATFGMDRVEVTNEAYRRCVIAGRCAPSSAHEGDVIGAPDHPVVGVRWTDARDYCGFVGGRLPTQPEWEKAARGDDELRRFPWGRTYDSHLANHGRSPIRTDDIDGFLSTAPVGSFPGGASPYGVLDLAGNVSEWTGDVPVIPHDLGIDVSSSRAFRGGSYMQAITTLRVTAFSWAPTDAQRIDLGFRCAYDPE